MDKSLEQLIGRIRGLVTSGEAKLPVLPASVMKINAAIRDESKGAADIAAIISEDASFSATVLNLANSACFNFSNQPVRSLSVAVQRLGAKRTLQLLMAISGKMHMHVSDKRLQQIIQTSSEHSLMVAAVTQQLADRLGTTDAGEAFTAGLMHDIGIPALICAARQELAELSPDTQSAIIRVLHREIGAMLLTRWELPEVFAMVAQYHGIHSDQRPTDILIDYVDVADRLLQQTEHQVLFDSRDDIDLQAYPPTRRIGASQEDLDMAISALDDHLDELKQVFNTAS